LIATHLARQDRIAEPFGGRHLDLALEFVVRRWGVNRVFLLGIGDLKNELPLDSVTRRNVPLMNWGVRPPLLAKLTAAQLNRKIAQRGFPFLRGWFARRTSLRDENTEAHYPSADHLPGNGRHHVSHCWVSVQIFEEFPKLRSFFMGFFAS